MNTQLFLDALKIAGLGMLGIFIFMLIFYFSILLMNKYSSKKQQQS
ncbi:MAG TPA: hypothetical protein PLL08_02730 [Bacteroidales bacterium]|jgi:Na+-transporting methylmalonyl-CoA/oxaloacetate decarboxylase gamma subunit|nr:hypothetical protein [Bacteroidales bacterium]HRR04912.1 hypothetical protein [Bacteroidales bacterium]HXK73808.1 hypothetical protein [Bacteroidales bacterium]